MGPLEHRDDDGGRLRLVPLTGGCFRLSSDDAGVNLSEPELRWLVTTAGPAVLPAQKIR